MERKFLEQCLEKGMSLEAIGREVGKHPSTVGYWLKKHGLSAHNADRHAPKGELDREELETLVNAGLTLREIAERLERSGSAVRHWMNRYGLRIGGHRRSPPPGNPKRADMDCRRHGTTTFVLEGRGYYRCARCRSEAVSKRRRTVKRMLVEEAGGRCAVCGYSRCQEALHFHHLDPTTKAFHIGHQGQSRSLARSRAEAEKCILLCGNCHTEVEAGIAKLPIKSGQSMSVRGRNSD
jgi:transposase-like protein